MNEPPAVSKMKTVYTTATSTMTASIKRDESGFTHIVCDCQLYARKSWCEHTLEAYTEGSLDGVYKEWSPAIVVFARPSFLIVPVVIVPLDDGRADVERVDILFGDPSVQGSEIRASGGESIGFISNSDGRGALRRLILEWLPSLPYKVLHVCKSPYHTQGSSPVDAINPEVHDLDSLHENNKRQYYRDLFSIRDIGMCGTCYESSRIDADVF